MKRAFWLFLCIVSSFIGKAQSTLPPAFEIKADTAKSLEIPDQNWQMLEDPSAKFTLDQVTSAAFDSKFHGNTTRVKAYDYHINTYWTRYRVKNSLSYPVKITIPEDVAYAWLYIPQANNKWQIQTTGTMAPWSKRDGLKRISQFVVTIAPGREVQFYEKDVCDFRINKPKIFTLNIGFADTVINTAYINNDTVYYRSTISSIIWGFLLMAALINLLFYRIVREKVYLYFSIFLFSYGLYTFLKATDIVFREHRYLNMYVGLTALIIAFISLMHFIRNFLSTRAYTPKLDKFLIALSFLQAMAFLIVAFLPPYLTYHLSFIIITCCAVIEYTYIPFILVTMLFYIRKNKRAAKTGIFAILPGLLWWGLVYTSLFICEILNELYKIPYPAFYKWGQSADKVMTLICLMWMIITFSWILFKRYQDLQQSLIQSSLDREIERSQLIEKQNIELEHKVEARTAELKQSVEELKATQDQLVQSEKLASLGELTAGIAHEIQNPLNFVNNFSDVSMELVDEMEEELVKGDTTEAIAIAHDIKQNLGKIMHHGKRADGIVKNMLEHSRNNSGEKQLTDINALADEYLRLSYHGLRAKDKMFNSNMETDFDPAVPKMEVIGQDIGRVLLNLYNNAFYAVQQRKKAEGDGYKPEVKVNTKLNGKFIEIRVTDNGTGIPDAVKGKILQPFFTTKPTGEGTGLGLSLSYDIVVKGHGGTMEINSKEGEFTEFKISLPV